MAYTTIRKTNKRKCTKKKHTVKEKIKIQNVINHGANGQIRSCILYKHNGPKQIICKYSDMIEFEYKQHLFLQCNVPSCIPKIEFYGYVQNQLCLGMEKLDGTLYEFLQIHIHNEPQMIQALITIVSKLHLLQKKCSFMHRDLHLKNIMYRKRKHHFDWYFIDFGFSYSIKYNELNTHYKVIHEFNPTHDLRMLFVHLFFEYKQNLSGIFLQYVLHIVSSVSNYIQNTDEFYTHDTYENMVMHIDPLFHPKHILSQLRSIQNHRFISEKHIQYNLFTHIGREIHSFFQQ